MTATAVTTNISSEEKEQSPRTKAEIDRFTQQGDVQHSEGTDEDDENAQVRKRHRFTNRLSDKDEEEVVELRKLWEPASTDHGWKQTDAAEKTMTMVYDRIESVIRQGLLAYHGWESMSRDLAHAKEDIETKERDIKRLRAFEEQSRTTVSNLLRAVETCKSDTNDACRAVQMEARLRTELSALRLENEQAISTTAEYKHKVKLLEEDLRLTKSKLTRVCQERIKLDRDSRAAVALALRRDDNSSSDVDFYKRKVSELTIQLQVQQALTSEKTHQLDEMRRQMERSMSQSKLANIRAGGTNIRNHRHST